MARTRPVDQSDLRCELVVVTVAPDPELKSVMRHVDNGS
jgi:hypothetical protein